jgi:hypothetical protein
MNDVSRWLKACLLLSTLATAVCANARASSADELVKFDSAPYILGQLQQRRAIERGEMAMPTTNAIEGYLSKPDGEGPFPAVVYLHGCGGLGKAAHTRFSDLLTGWGYVSLAVDSFATRGIEEACNRPMPDRQADAWGALLYLSKLPFVDRERIAVVGSSQGGFVCADPGFDTRRKTIRYSRPIEFQGCGRLLPVMQRCLRTACDAHDHNDRRIGRLVAGEELRTMDGAAPRTRGARQVGRVSRRVS